MWLSDTLVTGPATLLLQEAGKWLVFRSPRELVIAMTPEEVMPALQRIQAGVEKRGLCAAGLLAYEAAPGLDASLSTLPSEGFPRLWFGLYDQPLVVADPGVSTELAPLVLDWQPSMDEPTYLQAIERIRRLIYAGDTYQVNFSYRLRANFKEDPRRLFQQLWQAQRPAYGGYLDLGDWVVCSASPELLFRLDGERIQTRPMKGTAARGPDTAGDRRQAEGLLQSTKDRAENLMIVDMVRNDLGRIAELGSVQVPELFTLEKYPGVWQLTSKVEARTRAGLAEILAAVFPAASITGAPKARTMEIISELETSPRRIYTGSLGFILPGRRAQFNVAIRTALVDRRQGRVEFGTGGGVLWDSSPQLELHECRAKARILSGSIRPVFSLLESLLWTPEEGLFLLTYHLERLQTAAEYFDYPLDLSAVRRCLEERIADLPPVPHKLRLLVDREGEMSVEAQAILTEIPTQPRRVALAVAPVDSDDPFLYHKTTQRAVYTQARQARPGFDDIILYNARDEVTEATQANVVVELEGERYTPPLACGLLAGTYRRWLLEQGKIQEGVIHRSELSSSRRLWLLNSVRGWMPAILVETESHP